MESNGVSYVELICLRDTLIPSVKHQITHGTYKCVNGKYVIHLYGHDLIQFCLQLVLCNSFISVSVLKNTLAPQYLFMWQQQEPCVSRFATNIIDNIMLVWGVCLEEMELEFTKPMGKLFKPRICSDHSDYLVSDKNCFIPI